MNSSCFFHPPIHLLWVLNSTQPADLGIARAQPRGPQTVLADKLLQFRRVFQKGPHEGFFFFFLFRMFRHFAFGLVIEFVRIVLDSFGKGIRIERSLHHLEMFYELEGNIVGGEVERSLAAIPHVEQHAEERLVPAVNFFQLLGIDGQRDAVIVGPQPVARLAVIVAREGAAGTLFIPTHRRDF